MGINKIKEKVHSFFQLKTFLPVSLGLLIIVTILRIVQLNVAVDFTTGFFEDSFLVPLLFLVIALFVLNAALQLACNPIALKIIYHGNKMLPGAIICLLVGVCYLVESIGTFVGFLIDPKSFDVLVFFTQMFGLASAAVFSCQAWLFYKGKYDRASNHPMFLFVCGWGIFTVMHLFVRYMTIASLSEHLFELLFLMAVTLFLVFFARMTGGYLQHKQRKWLVLTGCLSLIFGVVCCVPSIFCKLFQPGSIGKHLSMPQLTTVALTVFTGYTLFLMIRNAANNSESQAHLAQELSCEYQYEALQVDFESESR